MWIPRANAPTSRPGGGGGTVEKTADRQTATVGSVIAYRITFRARSRGFFSGLYLLDRIPRRLALVNVSGVAAPGLRKVLGRCRSTRQVLCRLPSVPPGVSVSFTVRTRATASGTVVNSGTAGSNGGPASGSGAGSSNGSASAAGVIHSDRSRVTIRPRKAVRPQFTG